MTTEGVQGAQNSPQNLATDPATRETGAYGANPYPGRQVNRDLDFRQGKPGSAAWMEAHKAELLEFYFQAITWVRTELDEPFRRAWAAERWTVRLAEIQRADPDVHASGRPLVASREEPRDTD